MTLTFWAVVIFSVAFADDLEDDDEELLDEELEELEEEDEDELLLEEDEDLLLSFWYLGICIKVNIN